MNESVEKTKSKVVGSSDVSQRDNRGNTKDGKRGVVGRLGHFVYSHWSCSFYIVPLCIALSIILLFFLKGKEGGKE
jgi:hypothetical protein